jgi:hypothetical protein
MEIIMKIQKVFTLLLVLLGILFVNASAQNTVPTMINYQGFLTDTTGRALDGTYMITFRLYEQPTGVASIKWEEEHTEVTVVNGLFNVLLGSVNALSAEHLDGDRYLEIKVGDEVELTPRMRLASVAYALHADKMEPDYDSGWFAVSTRQHYPLDLGFNLTDLPMSIQIYWSNNAFPQFGANPIYQIQAGQYYGSGGSMGAYVEIKNASQIKIHTANNYVIHAWTNSIDGYDARATTGFYRVLLWK